MTIGDKQYSTDLDELTLVEDLKRGDQSAFRKIVETWQNMVYNTALGILQNESDAEDVAQETFVQVFESIQGFKGASRFSTWLYRITLSKSMDHIRARKRKKRFAYIRSIFGDKNELIIDPPDFQHPGVIMDNKEKSGELFRAVEKLPENQRIAFVLHKLEGLSYQEISEAMDTTVPAVDALLHRAKTNLRKLLESYYRELDQ